MPLVYPVLGYLFVRMLIAGFRPRRERGPLIPLVPVGGSPGGPWRCCLVRIALNIDRLAGDRHRLRRRRRRRPDRRRARAIYDGQLHAADRPRRLLRAAQLPAPTSRSSSSSPGAAGSSRCRRRTRSTIVFDLAVVALARSSLGRRLRDGSEGAALGIALAFAWLAYPYTLYALDVNGNDELVAAPLLAALLAFGSAPARGPVGRRSARRPSSGRSRSRRCSRPAPASGAGATRALRGRLRRRLGGGPDPAASRRRLARVLRPHLRLPGLARLAVQRLGARALARHGLQDGRARLPGPARDRPLLPAASARPRCRSRRSGRRC